MTAFLAERDQCPEVSLPPLLKIFSEPVMFLPVKAQCRELPDAVGAELALATETALLLQPLTQGRETAHMTMAVRPTVFHEPVILPLPANLGRLPLKADPIQTRNPCAAEPALSVQHALDVDPRSEAAVARDVDVAIPALKLDQRRVLGGPQLPDRIERNAQREQSLPSLRGKLSLPVRLSLIIDPNTELAIFAMFDRNPAMPVPTPELCESFQHCVPSPNSCAGELHIRAGILPLPVRVCQRRLSAGMEDDVSRIQS